MSDLIEIIRYAASGDLKPFIKNIGLASIAAKNVSHDAHHYLSKHCTQDMFDVLVNNVEKYEDPVPSRANKNGDAFFVDYKEWRVSRTAFMSVANVDGVTMIGSAVKIEFENWDVLYAEAATYYVLAKAWIWCEMEQAGLNLASATFINVAEDIWFDLSHLQYTIECRDIIEIQTHMRRLDDSLSFVSNWFGLNVVLANHLKGEQQKFMQVVRLVFARAIVNKWLQAT